MRHVEGQCQPWVVMLFKSKWIAAEGGPKLEKRYSIRRRVIFSFDDGVVGTAAVAVVRLLVNRRFAGGRRLSAGQLLDGP